MAIASCIVYIVVTGCIFIHIDNMVGFPKSSHIYL